MNNRSNDNNRINYPGLNNSGENGMSTPDSQTDESASGYLTVRVTTARGSIPLEGATVTVLGNRPENSDVQAVFTSGRDGLTPRIRLTAPPKATSESPGFQEPFYTYNLMVDLDGFYKQYYQNIPVFSGISALQTADMIPLPLNGIPDRYTPDNSLFFEGENPDL